jgi:hypothetical protein
MNTLNKILSLWRSSVQPGTRSTNSSAGRLACAAMIASLAMCGGARAANVLINPGAEAGDLTGWHESIDGYKYVVSTNQTIPGSGSSNFLAHSGGYTFQLFDTTATSAYIYQDFAAAAGSQWSASCWAICYASNYFNSGAQAHMQVVFYDVSNNVVPYPNTFSSSGGVLGSLLLDPVDYSSIDIFYTIVPPPAVDASGWLFLQPTNLFFSDPANLAGYQGGPLSTTLTAPTNTAFVRYQLEFDNVGTDGGDVYWDDCVLNKLNFSNPDITTPPVAVTTYAGLPASFSVVASHTGAYPNEKLTYQWQYNGVNLPPAGGVNDIAGNTTSTTLSFTNLHGADSGLYSVVVTVKSTAGNYTNTIRTVPVPLTVLVLSPLQKANVLGPNFGFENSPVWPLFEPFNGCYFASSNNVYGTSTTPVNVLDGNWVALIGANGDRDNGFHHAYPAAPGSLWKAGGYAYISSQNDYIAGNTCRLQIWFKDAFGVNVAAPTYESFKIYGLGYTNADAQYTNIDTSSPNFGQVGYHAQLPRDQWVYMPVTNMVNNGGIGLGDDLPYNTMPNGYFMVPTNAYQINFQVYEYCPVAGDNPQSDLGGSASDAVYWDDMQLIQLAPVTNLTAAPTISGNKINLSFSAGAGVNYAVLYKTNLSDATWNVLTNVAAPLSWQTNVASVGVTYPLTVSDSITAKQRFYRVLSQ